MLEEMETSAVDRLAYPPIRIGLVEMIPDPLALQITSFLI